MSRLSQRARIAMLAGALLMPVLAQDGSADPSGAERVGKTDTNRDRDHEFNFGWLGLLGLAGLIPRRRQNHDTNVHTTR
jgi:MYXO-CTERM domain-containing protein